MGSAERMLFLHDADVLPGPIGALGQLDDLVDIEVPRHPGFGSPLDDATEEWDSVADLAQHYLHDLDGEQVHLAGAGFGGWIALEMAVRAPRRFASLVLVSPYGVKLFGPTDREFADVLLLDPSEVVELGWADPAAVYGLRMPGFPRGLEDAEYEQAFADRAALARYAWKPFLHDPRLRRWLHVVDVPTLVVVGDRDRMVTPEHSRTLAGLLPRADYVEIPGAGHYPYLETPEAFVSAVAPFVAANSMTGAGL
ncbi:alpha/beta fold hydrolase [Qaidamihabitans albus]|uniref:alpha/beta fold hydrolase n=1 Tax=Qaidamihabitans albus TaxID=2795733 RepID=UPI0018F209D8|nr:alpha/beta hydrolase [Qaidamihabitans albus]